MGRIPVIFSANIAGFESASFDGVTMDNFGRIVSFHWPELLGKMINCRAARVGPSQRVETRPRAALSCAALLFVGAAPAQIGGGTAGAGGRPYTSNEAAEITSSGADGSSTWRCVMSRPAGPERRESPNRIRPAERPSPPPGTNSHSTALWALHRTSSAAWLLG